MATINTITHVEMEEDPISSDRLSAGDGSSDGLSRHFAVDFAAGRSDEKRVSSLSAPEIVGVSDKRRESSVSQCSVEMVDLEAGIHFAETNVHLSKCERECRICHMILDASNQESGVPIELGCSCKDDLAAAHKQCAETWFKIKGNKTCEICGSVASNVFGTNESELLEHWNEANDDAATAAARVPSAAEIRNFWRGHRFLNFLLACMVFAFVISWLFHFNVPS